MYPFVIAAVLITVYFVGAALQRPRPAEILAIILWAAYAVYEYYVANGTLCDPYCNIRVDLVLFFPLLGYATYLALRKAPSTGAVAVFAVICLGVVAWATWHTGNVAVAVAASVGALIVGVLGIKSRFSNRA